MTPLPLLALAPRLAFGLPMHQTYPVRLTFAGARGTGTWGDPATRGGVAEATRR
ncbi:MAG TPA: hypothetical protein VFS40_07140 [Gemmatimonadales bacterium]|nr:hypothetical protein [Gemmatimonadales bacterium]